MKHFVHSGDWKFGVGVTTDAPRMFCRVARGGIRVKGEEVSLEIGGGIRPVPGFVARTGGTGCILYTGSDEVVARRVAEEFDRKGRHSVASRVRRQGVSLSGVVASILPEGGFRLEKRRGKWTAQIGADPNDHDLLLFVAVDGGGGRIGDVDVLCGATTATVIDKAHVRSVEGASLAVIAKLRAGERLVVERIRANDFDRAEWEVIVFPYHGSSAEVEFTEERMPLGRWTEREAEIAKEATA